jgi:hypothetical protein
VEQEGEGGERVRGARANDQLPSHFPIEALSLAQRPF